MEYNRDHLLDVVRTIFKWKKPIIITCVTVGVLTAIISLMLPNYYEASTTFYAASPELQSPSVIFGESNKELEFYGEGEDMDRLIQAAESNDLFHFMVQKFDLYNHYDIDTSDSKAPFKLRAKFYKHFNIQKNERDAIVLSVEDKNPELAASMANIARDQINNITNNLIRGSQNEIIKSFEKQIEEKQKTLDNISDSLSAVRNRYGVFDAGYQREVMGTQVPNLTSSIASDKAKLEIYNKRGRRDSINAISARIIGNENRLEAITKGKNGLDVSKGISLVDQYFQSEQTIMEELGEDRAKYERYKSAFAVPKPALFIQDHAEVPVVKSRPKRSFIVIGAGFIAFLFSILGVLILEYNKDVDWKSIVNAK